MIREEWQRDMAGVSHVGFYGIPIEASEEELRGGG